MRLYCGIDLHSNNVLVSVIDEHDQVIDERRLGNDLTRICTALAPYREALAGVVVDAIQDTHQLTPRLRLNTVDASGRKPMYSLKEVTDDPSPRYLGVC